MSTFAYQALRSHAAHTVRVGFTDARVDLAETQPHLRRNLGVLAQACGAAPALMTQVHGDAVAIVSGVTDRPVADALITAVPDVALVVRVADCVPVLLADPGAPLVAAVHAGRRGLVAGVIPRAVDRMRELGATDIEAWIGPHICGRCYEVPESMHDDVAGTVPEASTRTRWDTSGLDLGAGATVQLTRAGCRVVSVAGCTYEEPRWPSYRRDGVTSARMAGVVWMSLGSSR